MSLIRKQSIYLKNKGGGGGATDGATEGGAILNQAILITDNFAHTFIFKKSKKGKILGEKKLVIKIR